MGHAPDMAHASKDAYHPPRPLPSPPDASLASYSGGVVLPKENILTVPCDVLIPAAIGGVITEENANDLQCKVGAASLPGDVGCGRCWTHASLWVVLWVLWGPLQKASPLSALACLAVRLPDSLSTPAHVPTPQIAPSCPPRCADCG